MATARKAAKKKAAPANKGAAKKKTAKKSTAKKSDMKTKPTTASVEAFIAKVTNPVRRKDAETALALMKRATRLEPTMWGPSIIGYGAYHYKYESGREGDMCMTGFSPRSGAMVFYVIGGVPPTDELYKKLGRHKLGGSCLYINKLADVDLSVLEKIIAKSLAYMRKTHKAA